METITAKEIAKILEVTKRAINLRADVEGWPYLNGDNRAKRYLIKDLPPSIQVEIVKKRPVNAAFLPGISPEAALVAAQQFPIEPAIPADIISLSSSQQQKALAKHDLLRFYTQKMKSAPYGRKNQAREDFERSYTSGFLYPDIYKVLGPVSWKTIEGWKVCTQKGASATLADNRGRHRKGQTRVDDKQARYLIQCAFHPNRWLIAEVIREAQHRMADDGIPDIFSESTYRRWLERFKQDNYDIWTFQRGGKKRWNDECCLAIDRDPTLINVGDVLVADGHKLNFEIINPWTGKAQRMTLIVFFDMRSNYPCGWEIMPTENAAAIHAALRRAILALGKIPRVVYLDNGRAFKARVFTETDIDLTQSGIYGLYEQLGIQTVFAWPYHGQSKTVERFFKYFAELERKCLTYVGTSIEKQPPRLNRGEFLHRNIYRKLMEGKCLTLEIAHMAVAAWFDEYAATPQPRSKYLKGYTPIDLFEPGRGDGVDRDLLTYLMWSKKDATIRGSRIEWRGKKYYHDALYGKHKKVEIRYDLQDTGYVAVFDGGELLCIAHEQDKVHPMATHLGTDEDRALLDKYMAIKKGQEKRAATISRKLLEEEILPAHRKQLEMDGVTAIGPVKESEELKQKQLTRIDREKIEKEVAQYNRVKPKSVDMWAKLDNMPEAERYEQLVRYEAQGLLIPREHSAFMRYFEQTSKYEQLEKAGYWENVRTTEIMMRRRASN